MSELGFCNHTRPKPEVENKIDPDDGNLWLCDACCLPIFSTPFITTVDPNDPNNNRVMHDQCANDLPPKLEGLHQLHLKESLVLHQDSSATNNNNYCSRCCSKCGSKFYKCDSNNCDFQLDLACALTIKIVHRSHKHRLTAIKGKSLLSSFICGICETQHRQPDDRLGETWDLRSYVCSVCDFWIHPKCALLPNAIVIDKLHPHPLLLIYFYPTLSFYGCEVCEEFCGLGTYSCLSCLNPSIHIKCAIYSDPDQISFKSVLIREAEFPGLIRLPMPNENTSVMSCILTNVGGASTSDDVKLFDKLIHEHPLILHEHPVADVTARVCNACVQLISASDSFYSCDFNNNNNDNSTSHELTTGPCRDFFLHRCCAHLSNTLQITLTGMTFTLVSKAHTPFNMFLCHRCQRRCNGFAYVCDRYYVDVVCAYTLTPIMHDAHAKSHVLATIDLYEYGTCNCCNEFMNFLGHTCNTCSGYFLHAKCALLPDTVNHKFDKHPLKLITTKTLLDDNNDHLRLITSEENKDDEEEEIITFCEICEKDIDDNRWYYGCKECDQCFHIDCIPTVDRLSSIKFGLTAQISCHDCPVAIVRALSVDGYPCGYCRKIIRESDEIAFECSECYFRIHCAKKLLVTL